MSFVGELLLSCDVVANSSPRRKPLISLPFRVTSINWTERNNHSRFNFTFSQARILGVKVTRDAFQSKGSASGSGSGDDSGE